MRSLSVELKLAAVILAVALAAALLGARLSGEVYERAIAATGLEKLRQASELFGAHQRAEVGKLASVLDLLSREENLVTAFTARDRNRLLELAGPTLKTMQARDGISNWYFIEPDGTVFLRVHRPDSRGDRPERLTLRQAMATGQLFAGLELGKTTFALRVVRPWTVDGKVIGYLELAEPVGSFLATMKSRTGDDYGLLVEKKYLDRDTWVRTLEGRPDTWGDRVDVLVVGATTFQDGIVDYDDDLEAVPEEGLLLGELVRGDRTLLRGAFPVRDVQGRIAGGLFVLRDDTGDRRAIRGGHVRAALVLIGIGLASGLAIALLVRLLLFRRLRTLRRELEARAAAAHLPESRVVDLHGEDELGRLERLFDRMLFPLRGNDPAPPPAPPEAR